jgi:hypothetical protein
MKRAQLSLSVLLAGLIGYIPIAASGQAPAPGAHQPKGVKPGVIGAVALNKEGTYCHLRFPAIRPSTITSAKPTLKPVASDDIIDFYGACDYDPVGKEEVLKQKQMYEQRMDNQYQ